MIEELLLFSRFLAFSGIVLNIARICVEAARSIKRGSPPRRVVVRRLAYLPLLGVAGFYARTLFWADYYGSASMADLTFVNLCYAAFFWFAAIPKKSRAEDHPSARPFR